MATILIGYNFNISTPIPTRSSSWLHFRGTSYSRFAIYVASSELTLSISTLPVFKTSSSLHASKNTTVFGVLFSIMVENVLPVTPPGSDPHNAIPSNRGDCTSCCEIFSRISFSCKDILPGGS